MQNSLEEIFTFVFILINESERKDKCKMAMNVSCPNNKLTKRNLENLCLAFHPKKTKILNRPTQW